MDPNRKNKSWGPTDIDRLIQHLCWERLWLTLLVVISTHLRDIILYIIQLKYVMFEVGGENLKSSFETTTTKQSMKAT